MTVPLFGPREYRPFPLLGARNDITERVEIPTMIRLLDPPRGGAILDVGCGPGFATIALARLLAPSRIVGVDIDESLLDEARARHSSIEWVHGDVRALPFADATYDLVCDFGTLFHIGRPDDAIREIARVLRPGGWFIHETKWNALLSHPIRAIGGVIPWRAAPELLPARSSFLWSARAKSPRADGRSRRA